MPVSFQDTSAWLRSPTPTPPLPGPGSRGGFHTEELTCIGEGQAAVLGDHLEARALSSEICCLWELRCKSGLLYVHFPDFKKLSTNSKTNTTPWARPGFQASRM